jgi:hypothetical protein
MSIKKSELSQNAAGDADSVRHSMFGLPAKRDRVAARGNEI